jgi:hypothetical protein
LESLSKQNDCDLAFVPDDGAVVRFEHTRAPIADHARDVGDGRKARWDHAREMMTQLFDRLRNRELPVLVGISHKRPPAKSSDRKLLVGRLADLIIKEAEANREGEYSEPDIASWVSSISITRLPPGSGSRVVLLSDGVWGFDKIESRYWEAVDRKERKYQERATALHLLVEFDSDPLRESDATYLRDLERDRQHLFKEIWVVNNFKNDHAIWYIWPTTQSLS